MTSALCTVQVLKASRQGHRWPLHDVAATRAREFQLAPHIPLMQRAGLSVAQLAMAIAPHAQSLWIACGPGNNGGDGLEAASHLQAWGKTVRVTWLGREETCPPEARSALHRARESGVMFQAALPDSDEFDVAIDALFGLGTHEHRSAPGALDLARACAEHLNAARARGLPVLAVDLPSGLNGDTGQTFSYCVHASHTLSLLTIKPGLFTLQGRDHTGDVWFDDLRRSGDRICLPDLGVSPSAWLTAKPKPLQRVHHSHKGSYGEINIIGGADGMVGAVLLAARAAAWVEPSRPGAGKVFVGLLAGQPLAVDMLHPELMFRHAEDLEVSRGCTVMGCGAGASARALNLLIRALEESPCLVLDADALNMLAQHPELQSKLRVRANRGLLTVLTPHPLEAARLLKADTSAVQAARLASAQSLADQFASVVALKGSGTVVAAPRQVPYVNSSGNAQLATAGSGDVLAGLLGGILAQVLVAHAPNFGLAAAQKAVAEAVYLHGARVD
ncbi:MAG: hypothetical protein RLZZ126_876 [Pseudomonadota bacterium]|jgi:hydroxyethylthiazole kinase-like uncharacterized protein yjeF